MISSAAKRQRSRPDGAGAQAPISAFSSTLMEKPKRGRPTIPDNFILGARNQFASLLEESCSEIAWPLIKIRKDSTGTIENVRQAFQPLKDKPHNSGWANPLYRETVEVAAPAQVYRNRVRVGELQARLLHARAKLTEIERSVSDINAALKMAAPDEVSAVENEVAQRKEGLVQFQGEINRLAAEERALDKKCLDQEAFVYASQLLDFLISSERYAVNPQSVANALAGLPNMGWRQSHLRCSRMPPQEERLHYRVFNVIAELCKRCQRESKVSTAEFFKAQLPILPKKLGYTRDFVLGNWRDLRLAIDECLSKKPEDGKTPYVLASTFMRNATRQKNPLERMFAEQENLHIQM